MKAGSLFSGIGGGEIACHLAGIETVWYAENDPYPASIMAARFPGIPNHGDVSTIRKENVESVDLLIGGFPCQDISVANKERKGLSGDRSGLWFEFARILGELQPRWCLIENVNGLLSSNRGRDMGTIIGTLGELGYSVAYRVLDAQYFGLAQRRKRVFIVGYLGDGWRAPARVLFESESSRGDTPARRKEKQDIAGTLESHTQGGGFPGTDGATANHVVAQYWDGSQRSDTLDSAMLSKGQMMPEKRRFPAVIQGISHDYSTFEEQAPPITASNSGASGRPHIAAIGFGTKDSGNDAAEELAPTLRSMNFHHSHVNAGGQAGVAYSVALRGREGGATAEVGDEKSNALRSSQGGGDKEHVLDPSRMIVRRLTPKECERLQGFHDDWTRYGWKIPGATGKKTNNPNVIEISNTRRYRALGNAFPVPVVAWILSRLVEADER